MPDLFISTPTPLVAGPADEQVGTDHQPSDRRRCSQYSRRLCV